ncbi:MAG TPA: dialkylresorcinol condensing enzyme [Gammaproteobacteria bacterium]
MTESVRPKRVLAICYSQTGQLSRIADHFLAPLREDRAIDLHVELLRPVEDYPFPWPFLRFFNTFPETVHAVAPHLHPLALNGDEDFDLVIIFYQVWFLAPSLPITAFLQQPLAERLLRNKPVITVIACRNMWLMAQEKMKVMLGRLGARLLDNVVLVDPSPTMASLLTTPLWLLSGKRDYLKSLPPAGVDETSIVATRRFGLALRDALSRDAERGTAPLLNGLQAVDANPHLLVSEKAGTRSFYLWGKLLRAVGAPGQLRRYPVLILYVIFLIVLILTVVPVSLLIQALLRPLMRKHFAQLKQQFDAPSGSGTERMHRYGQ